MLNEATAAFIRMHRDDDVHQLALSGASFPASSSGSGGEVDKAMALQQIAGWHAAHKKLPTWAATEGIVYPPHLNMEQCSSELTAKYKAQMGKPSLNPPKGGLLDGEFADGEWRLVDLTGGFGVDFYFMAQALLSPQRKVPQSPSVSPPSEGFCRGGGALYVEQNPELCTIAEHNFRVLGLECSVVCGSAADVLHRISHAVCIYLDPARRDQYGARTYSIEDCTPNVIELLPLLREKTDRIVLKLSPMLDWHKAVSDLGCVSEVHIVSVANECKELIIEMRGGYFEERVVRCEVRGTRCEVRDYNEDDIRLHCVNILPEGVTQHFSYLAPRTSHLDKEQKATPLRGRLEGTSFSLERLKGEPTFLCEPNSSIMKAGCFGEVAARYHVQMLAANSHLFVSAKDIPDFPGRRFHIDRVSSLNKRELKENLAGVSHANIAVRNFPMGAADLRKRLRLGDGGETYIFATTLADGQRCLLICRKIG